MQFLNLRFRDFICPGDPAVLHQAIDVHLFFQVSLVEGSEEEAAEEEGVKVEVLVAAWRTQDLRNVSSFPTVNCLAL